MARKKKEVKKEEVSRKEINGLVFVTYDDGSVEITICLLYTSPSPRDTR